MSLHRLGLKGLRQEVGAISWLSLALFLGLSLYSHNPQDLSLNSLGASAPPANWCGYFGSFASDFLYQCFGMSAWVLILFLGLMSYSLFQKKDEDESPWKRQIWLVFLVISAAALFEIYLGEIRFYQENISMGGLVGSFLSHGLIKLLNKYGASLFLATLMAIGFIAVTNWSLQRGFESLTKGLYSMTEKISLGFSYAFRRSFESQRPKTPAQPHRPSPIPSLFHGDLESLAKEEEGREDGPPQETMTPPEEGGLAPLSPPVLKEPFHHGIKDRGELDQWKLPELQMLEDPPTSRYQVNEGEVEEKSQILVDKLSQFSVKGEMKRVLPGPAVTMFEFKPNADVKISKITELADDLSLALSSESLRVVAPIPGRNVVGIETSNTHRETVYFKDIIAHENFWSEEVKLPMALGREVNGTPKVVDLRKMPHLLVAGTTGSGKSVFVVCALTGLLFRHSPETLRLILIDPKQVDLATFNHIPHLLMPTVWEAKKAVQSLKWAVTEMEKRYRSMSKFGSRGLEAFNQTVALFDEDSLAQHEAMNQEFQNQKRPHETYYFTPQPYIVIVVEEFGDLMAVDKGNVEQLVVRLAQMARASGIHLILAMQSPRKDVVTGLIKTNIPGRVSFKVASKMDSRIILDETGAERLLARGDMLFLAPGMAKPVRHHGPWVSENEINSIMKYWSDQGEPEYNEGAMKMDQLYDPEALQENISIEDEDYDDILAWVASMKEVSASLIQRKFRMGYPRAARLIETLEKEGVIGPANGSKPRTVLPPSGETPP